MGQAVLRLKQGDADTYTDTVTGLSSLSGYTAEMYIKDAAGDLVLTIVGSISGLVVTYEIVNENTKGLAVETHWFETKVFDSSDHVYTPSEGKLIISSAIVEDPS